MEKVYKIATGGFKELPITQKVLNLRNAPEGRMGRARHRMSACFQITLKGNDFHISFSPKSTLIGKKRRISFLKRRTELNFS